MILCVAWLAVGGDLVLRCPSASSRGICQTVGGECDASPLPLVRTAEMQSAPRPSWTAGSHSPFPFAPRPNRRMARKTRAAKKAQDDEEQLSQQQQQHEEEAVVQEHGTSAPASSTDQVTTEKEQSPRPASPKGKGRQAETGNQKEAEDPPAVISSTSKQTMEDRKERMAELRKKMVSVCCAARHRR